jgi:YidC/Oxa1 family membrane protein insertase
VLAQAPFFYLLYRVVSGQGAGTLLGAHLLSPAAAPLFLALLAGIALVAWLTSRRTAMLMRAVPSPTTSGAAASGTIAKLSRVLPYSTVVAAAFVPMALALYLLTSTAWTLVENTLLRRGLPG